MGTTTLSGGAGGSLRLRPAEEIEQAREILRAALPELAGMVLEIARSPQRHALARLRAIVIAFDRGGLPSATPVAAEGEKGPNIQLVILPAGAELPAQPKQLSPPTIEVESA